jgi:hypothetical protein
LSVDSQVEGTAKHDRLEHRGLAKLEQTEVLFMTTTFTEMSADGSDNEQGGGR